MISSKFCLPPGAFPQFTTNSPRSFSARSCFGFTSDFIARTRMRRKTTTTTSPLAALMAITCSSLPPANLQHTMKHLVFLTTFAFTVAAVCLLVNVFLTHRHTHTNSLARGGDKIPNVRLIYASRSVLYLLLSILFLSFSLLPRRGFCFVLRVCIVFFHLFFAYIFFACLVCFCVGPCRGAKAKPFSYQG